MKRFIINRSIQFQTTWLLMLALSGCAAHQNLHPSWVDSGHHIKYPDPFYMTGIGADKDRERADEKAKLDLLKQIEVEIKGEEEITQIETSDSGDQYYRVGSKIKTKVSIVIAGLQVSDRWSDPDKGLYWSLAVLDREKASVRLKGQIDQAEEKIRGSIGAARRSKGERDYVKALNSYLDAYEKGEEILPLISRYDVIRPPIDKDAKTRASSAPDIGQEISEFLSHFKITKISGDQQKARIGRPPEGLAARLVYGDDVQLYPITEFPMVFSFERGRGEIDREGRTDSEGIIRSSIHRIDQSGNETSAIALKYDIGKIGIGRTREITDRLLGSLSQEKAIFTIRNASLSQGDKGAYKWGEGIEGLVIQIIKNMEDKGRLKLAVLDFREGGSNGRTTLSNQIEAELKADLALVDDISVIEKVNIDDLIPPEERAKSAGADMYVTGSYWITGEGLRINARLIQVKTATIISAGKVLINRDGVPLKDLPGAREKAGESSYDLTLDSLLNIEREGQSFNLKVWTDKGEYQIGDTMTFYFRSDRDCYVTLIDIGTSGRVTILFPNAFHKDNLIRAGTTYTIPDDSYGFKVNVDGPVGLERIKAIATTKPLSLSQMDFSRGFYSIERGDNPRLRDLSISEDKLDGLEWAEAYTEIFINPKGGMQKGLRGFTMRPPEKPIDIIGTPGRGR
ncbi:MAG: DUF4384 domain-containing protein [Nitrospirae bacterium]|nr:DUF4384 domain-containing protein [Nitrospirota bacterium]